MNLKEAASYAGVPMQQLLIWAAQGIGPKFTGSPLIAHSMQYTESDLTAWLKVRPKQGLAWRQSHAP